MNSLPNDVLKNIISYDVKILILLCRLNIPYNRFFSSNTSLWHTVFNDTWFNLSVPGIVKEKYLKFAHTPIPIYPNLLKVDWIRDWTDIAVAGGHIVNAVVGDKDSVGSGDIDIFFINDKLSKESVVTKISSIYKWLHDYYVTDVEPKASIVIEIGGGCVQFMVREKGMGVYRPETIIEVQVVILKLFASVYELISNFDLPNCGFAYRDTSKLGENNPNTVNTFTSKPLPIILQRNCEGPRLYYTESALDYFRTMKILYFNPTGCKRRLARMKKYKSRKYNTVIPINECLPDCSAENLIDYSDVSKYIKAFNISINEISKYIKL